MKTQSKISLNLRHYNKIWCLRPYLGIERRFVEAFPKRIQTVRPGAYNIHIVAEETDTRRYPSKFHSQEEMFDHWYLACGTFL
jgi:hypothetical protein